MEASRHSCRLSRDTNRTKMEPASPDIAEAPTSGAVVAKVKLEEEQPVNPTQHPEVCKWFEAEPGSDIRKKFRGRVTEYKKD